MKLSLGAFGIGALFSLGLGYSGMTDPSRVLGFLDILGRWDPSLLFVMGAAIPVYHVFWNITKKRHSGVFDEKLHVPTRRAIDRDLIVGAGLFGVGWGMAGICPGPGIASLGSFAPGAFVFVVFYFLGGYLQTIRTSK